MSQQSTIAAPTETREAKTDSLALAVVVVNTGIITLGFFMLYPLISVHLSRDLGFAAAFIGIVLATRQITQQGFTMFGGAIADQVGHKPMIALGMFIRAVGFVLFGFAASAPALLLAAFISGLGGLLFDASNRAALASLAGTTAARQRAFTLATLAGNVGSTAGPLLGVFLLQFEFWLVGVGAASAFVVGGIMTVLILPATEKRLRQSPTIVQTLRTVWTAASDLQFVRFIAAFSVFWFLYSQLLVTLPLVALRLSGNKDAAGFLYALSAAVAILFQYPVARLVFPRVSPFRSISIGLLLMAAGVFFAGTASGFVVMMVFIAAYGLGRLLVEPQQQVVVGEVAPDHALGAYYGFGQLALAIGGSLGTSLGGAMYDFSNAVGQPYLIWYVMAVMGLAGAVAITLCGRAFKASARL